jgi:hypothetical protein
MSPSEIDDAVLAVADEHWHKVAGHDLIAQRIVALVEDGRLIAQGDISRWRQSEVRLPL